HVGGDLAQHGDDAVGIAAPVHTDALVNVVAGKGELHARFNAAQSGTVQGSPAMQRSDVRVGSPSMLWRCRRALPAHTAASALAWTLSSVGRSRSSVISGTLYPQLVCTPSTAMSKICRVPGSIVKCSASASQPRSHGSTGS